MDPRMVVQSPVLLSLDPKPYHPNYRIIAQFAQLIPKQLLWNIFKKQSSSKRFIIFSDSLSCLQADFKSSSSRHPFILDILELYNEPATGQYDIVFCWLPSHVGITGYTMADAAAKAALNKSVTPLLIPYSDYKPVIRYYIKDLMQKKWDTQVGTNKSHAIKPTIGYTYLGCQSRFEEVIMRRCRIGHSRYTHVYLLQGEYPPFCIPCGERITVKHVLPDRINFSITRDNYFQVSSIRDLLM